MIATAPCEIQLSRGLVAFVDAEDFERVNAHNWHAWRDKQKTNQQWYACSRIAGKYVQLSRFIVNAGKGVEVDHRNGNPLDNRRENLRLTDSTGNKRNRRKASGKTSRYKGVSWSRFHVRWQVFIGLNKKNISLGLHRSEESAAMAYNLAAARLFGEFARLNVLPQESH